MKRKKFRKKITIIAAVIFVLVALYAIFKEDIFRWSCRNEHVGPSCMIVGLMCEESERFDEAKLFFDKSCSYGYALGCEKMANILSEEGRIDEAKLFFKKACSLDSKILSCQ